MSITSANNDVHSAHLRLSAFRDKFGLDDAVLRSNEGLQHRLPRVLDDLERRFYIYRKPHPWYNFIGIVAGIVSLVAIIPQIAQIVDRQSACDLSMTFLLGTFLVQMLRVWYSFGNKLYLNGFFALATALITFSMVLLKKHYDSDARCAIEAMKIETS